jgi:Na+-translocating ferredoxin:NAD+ oxidoreductase RnfA subunit
MKEILRKTFELLRTELILWVPCTCAAMLTLVLGRLQKMWIHGIFGWISTEHYHSALGGDVVTYDARDAWHLALAYSSPLSFVKDAVEVVAFVLALAVTAKMVGMIVEEQRPDLRAALRGIATQWRAILLFSIKYMAGLGAMLALLALLTASATNSLRYVAVLASKGFLYPFSMAAVGCVAWVLMPAAMRLLQTPMVLPLSSEHRKLGTVLMVVTSAVALAAGDILNWAEAGVTFDNRIEVFAASVANTLVENVPEVFLFIALALLARQRLAESLTLGEAEDLEIPPEPAS